MATDTPSYRKTTWYYGSASIQFGTNDSVEAWNDVDNVLRVTGKPIGTPTAIAIPTWTPTPMQTATPVLPSPTAISRAPFATFTLGSSFDDVRAAQGVPDSIRNYSSLGKTDWGYGYSTVTFDASGRVVEWSNTSGNLKLAK